MYQTTDVAYIYDWELLDNVNRGLSVQPEKITNCFVQAEVTVINPKINARIEKKIGVRLCTRLFVRP